MTGLPCFLGGPIPLLRSRAQLPSKSPLRQRVQHATISMRERQKAATVKGGKGKKVSPMVFALDMKGNAVWKLRGATAEDTEACTAMIGKLPSDLVQSLIEDSVGCSMVCEATLKASKGEGYVEKVLGIALVDIQKQAKNPSEGLESEIIKRAELLTVKVNSALPDVPGVRKKLILGTLKKLKSISCVDVLSVVAKDAEAQIEELTSCGFTDKVQKDNRIELTANLITLNPDPQKKIE